MDYKASKILILLVFLGLLIRIWNLGTPSLWIDEGFTINAAQATLHHSYPLLDSGKIYSSMPLITYITAGILAVVPFDPFNPWPLRLPSVFFGLGVIVMSYLIAKKLLEDDTLALLTAGIITFSYWEITWSREIRGYTALQFFILLAVTTCMHAMDNKNQNDLTTLDHQEKACPTPPASPAKNELDDSYVEYPGAANIMTRDTSRDRLRNRTSTTSPACSLLCSRTDFHGLHNKQ